jgi:putative lipoprotein (rSAM/lipoprotein system)
LERLEQWLLRCLGGILGLAVIGCGGAPAYGAPAPEYGAPMASYKLSGTVADLVTGHPVPGIQISFLGGKAVSAGDGSFSLTWTGSYCTACPAVADDLDGALNGSYAQASLALNLVLVGPGDGKWFQGTFEQKDLAVKLTPKP